MREESEKWMSCGWTDRRSLIGGLLNARKLINKIFWLNYPRNAERANFVKSLDQSKNGPLNTV
jgi:hypothetical protein